LKLDARLTLFMTLVGVFLTSLLLGNLIAGKVTAITIGGEVFPMSVGEIPFPLTFVLTDILNEFYGKRVVRRVTYLGFAMTALAFVMIHVAAYLAWMPGAYDEGWKGLPPSGWNAVFTGATRIQVASMAAFMTAQLIDISIFFLIKRVTGNRALWLRATGSTAVSQLIDTIIVTSLGFGHMMSRPDLYSMIGTAYVVKLAVAIAMTPLIYAVHALIVRVWKIEPLTEASGD
jgi:queuosine precursor transporter